MKKLFFGGRWISYLYGAAIFLEHSGDLRINIGFVERGEVLLLVISVRRLGLFGEAGIRKAEEIGRLEVEL